MSKSECGNVKWFDAKKGYGFIAGPGGQDVFVHFKHIDTPGEDGFRTLRDGERVEYDLLTTDKGLQARHVRRITQPGEPSTEHLAVPLPPRIAEQIGVMKSRCEELALPFEPTLRELLRQFIDGANDPKSDEARIYDAVIDGAPLHA